MTDPIECLNRHDQDNDPCSGDVEMRYPLSGTGRSFPRCDGHWEKRLELQQQTIERYAPFSDVPPSGFDPTYAGERWEDTY